MTAQLSKPAGNPVRGIDHPDAKSAQRNATGSGHAFNRILRLKISIDIFTSRRGSER